MILIALLFVVFLNFPGSPYLININNSEARKPAIYLYHEEEVTFKETLLVTIPNGYATVTIPEIPLGPDITWNNFEVFPGSKIKYRGNDFSYLFYEESLLSLELPFSLQ